MHYNFNIHVLLDHKGRFKQWCYFANHKIYLADYQSDSDSENKLVWKTDNLSTLDKVYSVDIRNKKLCYLFVMNKIDLFCVPAICVQEKRAISAVYLARFSINSNTWKMVNNNLARDFGVNIENYPKTPSTTMLLELDMQSQSLDYPLVNNTVVTSSANPNPNLSIADSQTYLFSNIDELLGQKEKISCLKLSEDQQSMVVHPLSLAWPLNDSLSQQQQLAICLKLLERASSDINKIINIVPPKDLNDESVIKEVKDFTPYLLPSNISMLVNSKVFNAVHQDRKGDPVFIFDVLQFVYCLLISSARVLGYENKITLNLDETGLNVVCGTRLKDDIFSEMLNNHIATISVDFFQLIAANETRSISVFSDDKLEEYKTYLIALITPGHPKRAEIQEVINDLLAGIQAQLNIFQEGALIQLQQKCKSLILKVRIELLYRRLIQLHQQDDILEDFNAIVAFIERESLSPKTVYNVIAEAGGDADVCWFLLKLSNQELRKFFNKLSFLIDLSKIKDKKYVINTLASLGVDHVAGLIRGHKQFREVLRISDTNFQLVLIDSLPSKKIVSYAAEFLSFESSLIILGVEAHIGFLSRVGNETVRKHIEDHSSFRRVLHSILPKSSSSNADEIYIVKKTLFKLIDMLGQERFISIFNSIKEVEVFFEPFGEELQEAVLDQVNQYFLDQNFTEKKQGVALSDSSIHFSLYNSRKRKFEGGSSSCDEGVVHYASISKVE